MLKNPKNILVIKLRSIGDVVLSTAALQMIKANFPDTPLHLLVEKPIDELFENCEYVDLVYGVPRCKKGLLKEIGWYWKIIFDIFQKERYDVVIDLHGGPRSRILTYLSGARERYGYFKKGRGFFYTDYFKIPEKRYRSYRFMVELMKSIGLEGKSFLPSLALKPVDSVDVNEQRIKKPYYLVFPAKHNITSCWEPEKFAQVADYLQKGGEGQVIFTCGPKEDGFVAPIGRHMKTPFRYTGENSSLSTVHELISNARLVITNDSGPMHIAAALCVPVLALFGSGDPKVFYPSGPGKFRYMVYKKLECAPCTLKSRLPECIGDYGLCKKAILPEDVIRKLDRILPKIP